MREWPEEKKSNYSASSKEMAVDFSIVQQKQYHLVGEGWS